MDLHILLPRGLCVLLCVGEWQGDAVELHQLLPGELCVLLHGGQHQRGDGTFTHFCLGDCVSCYMVDSVRGMIWTFTHYCQGDCVSSNMVDSVTGMM